MIVYYQDLPIIGLAPSINDEDKNIEIEYEKYISGNFELCIEMPIQVITSTTLPKEMKSIEDWDYFATNYSPNLSIEEIDIESIKSREEELLEHL